MTQAPTGQAIFVKPKEFRLLCTSACATVIAAVATANFVRVCENPL